MSKRFTTEPKPRPAKSAAKPRAQKAKASTAPSVEAAEKAEETVDSACNDNQAEVSSPQLLDTPAPINHADETAGTSRSETQMATINLTKSKATRKDDRLVIFNFADGRAGSVQFLRSAFPEVVPETISMSGDFADPKVRVPKEKETPEQRKARMAALPKLTLAEKVAKAEKNAAKLREKLAKATPPATDAPAADQAAG